MSGRPRTRSLSRLLTRANRAGAVSGKASTIPGSSQEPQEAVPRTQVQTLSLCLQAVALLERGLKPFAWLG